MTLMLTLILKSAAIAMRASPSPPLLLTTNLPPTQAAVGMETKINMPLEVLSPLLLLVVTAMVLAMSMSTEPIETI